MKKYDVRCTSTEQTVRSLSGGNQQKVILARELESQPSLLVMAHPTRGLDIGAAGFVHEQMIAARQRGVGILLISADFDEILEMSDRILVCFEGADHGRVFRQESAHRGDQPRHDGQMRGGAVIWKN